MGQTKPGRIVTAGLNGKRVMGRAWFRSPPVLRKIPQTMSQNMSQKISQEWKKVYIDHRLGDELKVAKICAL